LKHEITGVAIRELIDDARLGTAIGLRGRYLFPSLKFSGVAPFFDLDQVLSLPSRITNGESVHFSRLENPKELQLRHNHEKILLLTVLLLCAQFKIHYL
jgi:hypothetical protein